MKENDVGFEACAHDAKRLSIERVLKRLNYIRGKIRDLVAPGTIE